MQVFKCDKLGHPNDEGDFVAVELDSTKEIKRFGSNRLPRSDRALANGDGFSLIVVFTKDGALKRLPGYGSVQMTAAHAAYLEEMRGAVVAFQISLEAPVLTPAAPASKSKSKKPTPAPFSDTDD